MKTAVIDKRDNLIIITFRDKDQDEWHRTLKFVQSIPGRDFKKRAKLWTAPALKNNIKLLKDFGFEVTGNGDSITQPTSEKPWGAIYIDKDQFPRLYPFQLESLQFLIWRDGRGLITDEMGLGKTVESLSYLKMYPEKRPVLIVTPASIKLQWKREYRKWVGIEDVKILYGENPCELNPKYSYIINWDILTHKIITCFKCKNEVVKCKDKPKNRWYCKVCNSFLGVNSILIVEVGWVNELKRIPFQIIIGDEIQAVCNPKAYRTKAFKMLVKRTSEFIGLSGTPIQSRPHQFFTSLNLVAPRQFPNRWKYYERYCDLKFNGFGRSYKGSTHTEELHELVSQVMIRRLKKEVMAEMPHKIRTVIPLEVGKEGKLEMVIQWIQDFLESGEKLVVFAWHIKTIDLLQERFKNISVKVYGGTSLQNRDDAVQRFQEDDNVQLFIGNILASGVGIDGLQNVCSNAVFAELNYVPKALRQAEDRLHRINQSEPVNIYYLISPVEEQHIMEILDEKTRMIDGVVDGKETEDKELLTKLFEGVKQ